MLVRRRVERRRRETKRNEVRSTSRGHAAYCGESSITDNPGRTVCSAPATRPPGRPAMASGTSTTPHPGLHHVTAKKEGRTPPVAVLRQPQLEPVALHPHPDDDRSVQVMP